MLGSCHGKISRKIEKMKAGSVFVIPDFAEIASAKTVSKTLTRLLQDGEIRRVVRGVFWKPAHGKDAPHPDDVAHALARSNTWRLAPSGDTALHIFGLQKEKPGVWTYVTDGTYRDYDVAGTKIVFQHASGKVLGKMSEKTALLVQVLKAYGRPRLSEETLQKIKAHLHPAEFKTLLEETKNAPAWVGKTVRTMLHRRGLAGD